MYQPTKQVENKEATIKYRANAWHNVWAHISTWVWLIPEIKPHKNNERLDVERSTYSYKVDYMLNLPEWWVKRYSIALDKELWLALKDGITCNVEIWKITWKVKEDSLLENCTPQ